MTRRKADVVAKTAQAVGLTPAATGRIVDAFLAEVATSLKAGESVGLGAFGSFVWDPTQSAPTGVHADRFRIKSSKSVKFKPGKSFG